MSAAEQQSHAPSLEAVALDLRSRHRVSRRRPRDVPVHARLRAMPEWLADAVQHLQQPEPALAKASDWLLDNDYLVERAVRQIQVDLPAGFYARLPCLEGTEEDGLPRAFSIAHGLLHASRLQLSIDVATRFVNAYQGEDEALSIAELWAFPALLRIACLELLVHALERLDPHIAAPAPATLAALVPPGLDDTDCVARALANLGVIDGISWKDFFQRTSHVEALLTTDPARVYARMDFETRDHYRRTVEALAEAAGWSEVRVARGVVERARAHAGHGHDADHVGHWLVGPGAREFERWLGARPRPSARARAWLRAHAGPAYALALLLATAAAAAVPSLLLLRDGASPLTLAASVALSLIPASVVSFTLVHWAVTLLVAPRVLPKLDFEKGISPDCRTVVAVPALVGDASEAQALLDRLELHYVANPDPALAFALLTDGHDAPSEELPGDADCVAALVAGIAALNERHERAGAGPFHLLHRRRRFNPREGCWMGWERKRGKLEELNHLLAGEPTDGFSVREGDTDALAGARFVIVLDADTQLPRGCAQRLVGSLAHPLNRARFDARGRVRQGYTVIQPRVEIAPGAEGRSWFSQLYSGDTAIDIYTRAVSDVYQDLFGSGIFVGKGIYEVASFRASLAGRVPDDALASHDLFEGVHGRAALASDLVLYESFPSRYEAYARRWHRWVRGDWQLLPWLWPRVPGPGGARLANRLSLLDRWKIADNLRRSLVPPSLVALQAAGWLALPGNPWGWTALGLLAPAAALFTDLVTGITRGRRRGSVRGMLRGLANQAGHWLLSIAFLANDARVALDAISRTLWRLGVSRRHLLQWTAAAAVEADLARVRSRARAWKSLAPTALGAGALGVAVALHAPDALPAAAAPLLLWALSPEIAYLVGRERRPVRDRLAPEDVAFLRRLARRTWLYFETFVGPEDHWLPPDNLQEQPHRAVAHRTSPTNIGMALVSTLGAVDFGYLGLPELSVRLRDTLDTLDRLPRHRGHLLNWYDTRLLAPLEPRYVSTVDSGNLAVCLVAAANAVHELAAGPVLRPEAWNGFLDTLALLGEAAGSAGREDDVGPHLEAMSRRARAALADASLRAQALAQLEREDCAALDRAVSEALERAPLPVEPLRELRSWLERTHHHVRAMRSTVDELAPWLPLLDAAPASRVALAAALREVLPPALALRDLRAGCLAAREWLEAANAAGTDADALAWEEELHAALEKGAAAAESLHDALARSAERMLAFAVEMDFRLLYDEDARRFRIGYNASADRLDSNHYDLLASEARLASFFAIAKGDVPPEHWFHLSRPVARVDGGLTLVSWGGSMFEYLMPPLLLRSAPGTLLEQSERAAVEAQRRWARRLGLPWGVSESAFASLDPGGSYRYQSFGVPGLGLRRGLARDRVVAAYAAALALPILPHAATENLRALDALGAGGLFGLFDAADFTPDRVRADGRFTPVRTYMAHHQGMILTALANALLDRVWVRRFHADLRVRSAELLLHERIPHELPAQFTREEREHVAGPARQLALPGPWSPAGVAGAPRMLALGNGRLSSWTSAAGAGGLRWRGHALTRHRPDATRDESGYWLYLGDVESGAVWSVGRQPTGRGADEGRAVFHAHLVELHRREHGIAAHVEVCVAAGDDLEIRRVQLTNESDAPRVLTLTSYAEVALALPLDDERHPAFSKLFVHAEWLPERDGLLFTRRPRQPRESPPALLHRALVSGPGATLSGYESDRRAFLGRGGDVRRPRGVTDGLSCSVGFPLDPVMSLQLRLMLEPYERCEVAFVTLAGGSRESVLETASRYETLAALQWAVADAASEAARELARLSIPPAELPVLHALASLLIAPCGALGASAAQRAANTLGPTRLWGLGISGDLPIVLLRGSDPAASPLLAQLVRAQAYWHARGLDVDLVVWKRGASSYAGALREKVFTLLREAGASAALGQRGGVHLVFADQVHEDELRLLECCARVTIDDARGTLAEQLAAAAAPPPAPPPFQAPAPFQPPAAALALERPADLGFDNGFGGFTPDGRAYVIHLEPGVETPAPWSNVLANDGFGCIVTESGGGFTWSENSGENRLTGWSNDPVLDPPSEALFLRDEETGAVFSVTPRPAGGPTACEIRHAAGATTWRRRAHGLEQELCVFVAAEAPVKIARLVLRNRSGRPRRITATYWAEWLLGSLPSVHRHHVVSSWESEGPALLARNPWNVDFGDRVAFLAATRSPHGVSTDRREFLGPEGDLADPAALRRWGLSGRVDAGADPGAAYQVHLDLAADGEVAVSFLLGQGRDREHALALVREWRDPARVARAAEEVAERWERRLGAVHVRTPDPAFDLLVNRWLPYQVLSSRVLARAGFYQASGAIGYRDQLQDVLALLHAEPERTRAHLLACAAHQFEEGDVLHWWHPPSDRGVRTRCSDDLLWLPYAVSHYVEATGDASVLDEEVPFLRAPELAPAEHDRYARFERTTYRRTLFEHCERALERGITRGRHGLPRIGSGDWNDGLDRVGARGEGESVWLGWFALAVLRGFARLCDARREPALARRWRDTAAGLEETLAKVAWDEDRWLRAFDDDGRPWGARSNDECRIDSIAQSWSALSGARVEDRAQRALATALRELVNEEAGLARLLWPPFDATPRDPGYVKAYPPGVRENGGQYSHAAAWLAWAFAALGDGENAWRLFGMLSPIERARTREAAETYRVEPYALAGDIGAVAPHEGRGGWSGYTGSAAWTWRLAVEAILGLQLRGGRVALAPCLPPAWDGFEAELRGPAGVLSVRVNVDALRAGEWRLDGARVAGGPVALPADGATHRLEVWIARADSEASPRSDSLSA